MFGVWGIALNNLEKKSFYSFLSLYVISSFVFIVLSAYWYFAAQKSMFESNQYYKLQHIADETSQKIIYSHMQGKKFIPTMVDDEVSITLIDVKENIIYGPQIEGFSVSKPGFFKYDNMAIVVSDGPQMHLDIKFVVVQSKSLPLQIEGLQQKVLAVMSLSVVAMIALAWVLSRFFMKPLHQKIEQIEGFVHDTAHELNTPITALRMSVSRALKKKAYDEKILKNISISTKQLFDIYTALSYLSFESQQDEAHALDISVVLEKSVAYYQGLSESKKIKIIVEAEPFMYVIDETKLSMLFGNLISNAIKYSMPNSDIQITLKEGIFTIQDHGIGIDKEKLSQIFERYNRQTDYAGGFGIGLSIVKKITQEYGIELEVISEKEKGSRFILHF